jgi:hypothetical protein
MLSAEQHLQVGAHTMIVQTLRKVRTTEPILLGVGNVAVRQYEYVLESLATRERFTYVLPEQYEVGTLLDVTINERRTWTVARSSRLDC